MVSSARSSASTQARPVKIFIRRLRMSSYLIPACSRSGSSQSSKASKASCDKNQSCFIKRYALTSPANETHSQDQQKYSADSAEQRQLSPSREWFDKFFCFGVLPLDHKTGPIIRRLPSFVLRQGELRISQGSGRRHA